MEYNFLFDLFDNFFIINYHKFFILSNWDTRLSMPLVKALVVYPVCQNKEFGQTCKRSVNTNTACIILSVFKIKIYKETVFKFPFI